MIMHEAMIFAAKAHDGQYRKGTRIPYIVHPFEVVQILTDAGGDETILCAGFLHDVVEDTKITIGEIERGFGREITELVACHTEDKALSWEERKQNKIEGLTGASSGHLLLTCADKLSNMRSIAVDYRVYREGLWERFHRGREDQRWYYGAVIEKLMPLKEYRMYQELAALYSQVFGEGQE